MVVLGQQPDVKFIDPTLESKRECFFCYAADTIVCQMLALCPALFVVTLNAANETPELEFAPSANLQFSALICLPQSPLFLPIIAQICSRRW